MNLNSLFEGRSTLGVLLIVSFVALLVPGLGAASGGLVGFVFFTCFIFWAAFIILSLIRNGGSL